ncbi:MAG: MBL fold metallo-hydrolase [Bacteroidota bacterium]
MITVKKFVFNPYQVNTYVLFDETGKCVIIDPGCYFDKEHYVIESFISAHMLIPEKILITHGHFDHILGNTYISNKFGVEIFINKNDLEIYKQSCQYAKLYGLSIENPIIPSGYISHNEIIDFGNSELISLHCPGHSPGSIVFYCVKQKFIVAGDVLFAGSVGRTDLVGGDMDTLIESIKEKLLILEDDTVVYCGHGEQTTIGNERRHNPFL